MKWKDRRVICREHLFKEGVPAPFALLPYRIGDTWYWLCTPNYRRYAYTTDSDGGWDANLYKHNETGKSSYGAHFPSNLAIPLLLLSTVVVVIGGLSLGG